MRDPKEEWCERELELWTEDIRAEQEEIAASNRRAAVLLIVSALMILGSLILLASRASGADHDPPPVFTVVNKIPPSITVINKLPKEKPQTTPGLAARPGEPVRVTPGVVIQRPFSEPTPGTIVQDRFGTGQPTSGVVWSLPRSAAGRDAGTSTGRVLGAVRYGRIENCST